MSVFDLPIKEIRTRLHNKELSVSDLVEASLERIKKVDETLNAFITVDEDGARARAKELDQLSADQQGALFGLPMGIKDNISTKGVRTTCASKLLADFVPVYDATVVEKLKKSQAVLMGKCNMDEFAMGATSETSAFNVVPNPWNTEHVSGGSSGGSAASVAASQVYFALGSDTGGSIRQPAAFCGVVGLKPTYGLVSRFGLTAFASSLDQIGPITKNVEDAALVLQVLAGHDQRDSTSAKVDVPDYLAALNGEISGLKLAVPKQFMDERVYPEVREKVLSALNVLERLGASWEEVSLSYLEYVAPVYHIIASAEASSNLARFDGVRYGRRADSADNLMELYVETRSQGFGSEVKRRILLGTYALSSSQYEVYYKKAQQVRTLIKQELDQVLDQYDLIIGPTTARTAWKIGEKHDDPLQLYIEDTLTCPANLAGLPAISLPCGMDKSGLPIGLQMMGRAFDESTLLRVAHVYEQETSHHKLRPQL